MRAGVYAWDNYLFYLNMKGWNLELGLIILYRNDERNRRFGFLVKVTFIYDKEYKNRLKILLIITSVSVM